MEGRDGRVGGEQARVNVRFLRWGSFVDMCGNFVETWGNLVGMCGNVVVSQRVCLDGGTMV
jgi:hypothetical protein